MLTIKKRGRFALALVAAACLSLTACGPPGVRALHRGDRLIQETNYEAAIAELSQAVTLLTNDPTDISARAIAYNLLGLAYHGAGDAPKALQFYEQAHTLNRDLASADFNLACLELEHSNTASARDFLTTYTNLARWNVDGNLKLGEVYFRLALASPSVPERNRQLDSAKKNYEIAQGITRTAEAGNNLGVIELLSNPRPSVASISNALLRFNVALAVDPQYSPALLNVGIVYDRYLNDGRKALDAYGKYLAVDPPPRYAKEVIALTNGLDKALRFQILNSAHATNPPPVSTDTASSNIIVTPSKPLHPPPATNPVETAQPRPATVPSPAVVIPSNPAPSAAVVTPPAVPAREPPPAAIPTPQVTQPALVPAAVATPVLTPVPTAAPTPQPTTSSTPPPPPKKSVLSKINPLNWFGGKSTPNGTNTANPTSTPVVTPLPDLDSRSVHYPLPEVSVATGNHQEAVRLHAEGIISEKASRLTDAQSSYQAATKADPSYFDACLSLGLVAIRTEDFSTALDALHHAVTLDPDSADARYAYAWALEKKNFFLDAANELEKLVAQKPNEIRAHLLLGNLYAQQLAQPDLARGHYQQVLNTDPKNLQAPAIRAWLQSFPAH
jgi:tetratricopeptide (TPR) repeat protein